MNTDPFAAVRGAPASALPVSDPYKTRRNEMDLFQLLAMLWRGKWWIILTAIITMIASITYFTQVAIPKYTASSLVALQSRNEQVVDFENVLSGLSGDQASINTEVEVLRARGLLDKLVERLNLEADPEFNKTLREQTIWSVAGMVRAIKELVVGPLPEQAPPNARKIRDDTTDEVLKRLQISNVRRSFAFRIIVTTEGPEKSALIADSLAEIYIAEQIATKFQANERATSWLADQLTQLETELDASENAVKEFNTLTDLVSPEALAVRNRQLKDFRDLYSDLTVQKLEKGQRVTELQAARETGSPTTMLQVAQDTELGRLFNTLNNDGSAARASFDKRYEEIVSTVQAEQIRADAQLSAIDKSISDLEAEVTRQSTELLRLRQLERVANANRLVYEYFLSREKEILAQRGVHQADSRLLSRAVVPEKPSSPRAVLLTAIAGLIGALIASALVLLREMRNSAFKTPEDLEITTGLPVMGEIVKAPHSKRRRIIEYIANKPTSALVETVRNLRTSILLSSADEPPQIIMLTSSLPGEGKTTQSLALAQNLSSMKKRVLMIDGDIRRRTSREYFGATEERGLFSVVGGKAELKDVVYQSDLLGIDVLFCEESKDDAAEFFSSAAYHNFLTKIRAEYDFVIIDTPPVLAVPDARVIGQSVDVTLYVVHWDATPRRQVQQGLRSFATVNVPISGLILNQIDTRRMRGYGQGYGYRAEGYYDRT